MSVHRTHWAGHPAWEKQYPGHVPLPRRIGLRLLECIAAWSGLGPLRPPPHRAGAQALATEARRLHELHGQGVRVPALLDGAHGVLRLGDLGPTLAARLRESGDDPAATDALSLAAIRAILDVHRRGAYLGQALPRNLTLDGQGVGFLDFEEDPLEVMTLEQAQARDWVLFAFGMAKFYDGRPQALQALLMQAFGDEDVRVNREAHRVGDRLRWLAPAARRFGPGGRSLAHALLVLAQATAAWLPAVLLGMVLIDVALDGELDLFTRLLT